MNKLVVDSAQEVLTLVPHLTGFVPSGAVVALALRGAPAELVCTAHLAAGSDSMRQQLLAQVIPTFTRSGVTSVLMVAYGDEDAELLADELVAGLAGAGIGLARRLSVRAGRYRDGVTGAWQDFDPVAAHLALAEFIAAGSAPLPSRAAMVAQIDPVPTPEPLLEALAGCQVQRAKAVSAWAAVLDVQSPRANLGPHTLAQALASLADRDFRDEVFAFAAGVDPAQVGVAGGFAALSYSRDVLERLLWLARLTPDEYAPPVCTIAAFVCWLREGNAVLAGAALNRALRIDPAYRLARLLNRALQEHLDPRRFPA